MPATARRYLEYLRLSYQVVLLQPYARNLTSATVKSPKLYWMDLGLLRHGTRAWGELTGPLFETLVVSEVRKWIDTVGRDVSLSFYRTRSGREVDLLITTRAGVIGVEIKNRARVGSGRRALACAHCRPRWAASGPAAWWSIGGKTWASWPRAVGASRRSGCSERLATRKALMVQDDADRMQAEYKRMTKTVTSAARRGRLRGAAGGRPSAERRPLSNLIETAALARIREAQFVDDAEMAEILDNDALVRRLEDRLPAGPPAQGPLR